MKLNNIITTGVICLHVLSASADLLRVNPGYPRVNYSSPVSTAVTYSPSTHLFSINATPSGMQFLSSEGTRSVTGTKSLQVRVLLDGTGILIPGNVGDDFVLSGTVIETVNGVPTTYSGTLLTGKAVAFGSNPQGSTGQYDLRFTPTGGQLLSYFSCGDIAITVNSAGSTFTGSFAVAFNGRATGTAGVEDMVAPTIQCPADIVVESHAFSGGIPGAYVSFALPTVLDNCDTNPTVTCTPPSGSFFPLPQNGQQTASYSVVCVAKDASGNSNSCSFVVTVQDTLAPEFADPNNPLIYSDLIHPIALTNDPGQAYATYRFPEPLATDNTLLSAFPTTVSAVDGNGANIPLQNTGDGYLQGQFPVGSECVITVTADDGRGNSAQHQAGVTVVDAEPPVISCPVDQTVAFNNGPVFFDEATASDNCPGVKVVCAPSSGSALPVGQNTISCVATDASGNKAQCSYVVTVRPDLSYHPTNVVVPTDPGQCSAVVAFPPSGTDDNSIPLTLSYDPASGSVFPKGTTTVTCNGSDTYGDTGSWTFAVTVNDLEKPVITAPAAVIAGTDPGKCEASAVALGAPVTSDNCGVASVVNNAPAVFPKGDTIVTWTVTDTSGNQATSTQTVTVKDMEKPVIQSPGDIKAFSSSLCSASIPVTFSDPIVTDNCGVASVICNPSSGSLFPVGTNRVVCTATDASGNTNTTNFNVIVKTRQFDPLLADVECSRIGFDRNGNSDYVWFRGNVTLSGGDQAEDFRTATAAFASLKVTMGANSPVVVYCNDNIPFNVKDNDQCSDTEKWIHKTFPIEEMTFRFKDDQHYSANMDINLPSSAATKMRNVGNLETVFIGDDETRFRYAFKNATTPITIVVDGIVLLSIDSNKAVSSAFPHWTCGKTVEVLFPERMVPGNTVAWYATSNPNAVSTANLTYSHAASASGNARDTYFNQGGRFFFRVPVAGLRQASADRAAKVEFTIGQPGVTKAASASFTVVPMRGVGACWKFGPCSDDADEDDQEDDLD